MYIVSDYENFRPNGALLVGWHCKTAAPHDADCPHWIPTRWIGCEWETRTTHTRSPCQSDVTEVWTCAPYPLGKEAVPQRLRLMTNA